MLFEAKDLVAFLQLSPLDTAEAPTPAEDAISPTTVGVLHRVVVGWLTAATGLSPLPGSDDDEDPPKVLAAWAIELAAIAYHRPSSASSDASGATRMAWDEQRRQAILAAAHRWALTLSSPDAVADPRGSFPCAPSWPSDMTWPGGRSPRRRSLLD
ncbi:hypothetical protein [Calidifontibacter indicus]|uniref:hypothetical protein n=1 Tax=Calidifontibacter indicus TaxID=419650 RepID=UPI003D7519FB